MNAAPRRFTVSRLSCERKREAPKATAEERLAVEIRNALIYKRFSFLLIGLTAMVAMLVAVVTFAVLRFAVERAVPRADGRHRVVDRRVPADQRGR